MITVIGFGSDEVKKYSEQYAKILDLNCQEILIKSKECVKTPWGGLTEVNKYEHNSYIVTLNLPVLNNNLLSVLAHELIHVWQLTTGKLVFNDDSRILEYSSTKYSYDNLEAYNTCTPWEYEAYANQDWLYKEAKSKLE